MMQGSHLALDLQRDELLRFVASLDARTPRGLGPWAKSGGAPSSEGAPRGDDDHSN